MKLSVPRLPGSLAEFQSMVDLTQPQHTCLLLFSALNLYLTNPDEGVEALNLLRGPRPMLPYDVQFLRDRLRGKTYLPLAYFAGV